MGLHFIAVLTGNGKRNKRRKIKGKCKIKKNKKKSGK